MLATLVLVLSSTLAARAAGSAAAEQTDATRSAHASTSDQGLHPARFRRLSTGALRTLPVGLVPARATHLRFSPDRRQLAYVGLGEGDPPGTTPRLRVVDIDDRERKVLSPPDVWPSDPSWSPDGRSIVYVDDGRLHLVDIPSGRDRRLRSVRSAQLWLPSFHPDGRSVLYTRVTPGGHHRELWTVPVRGGSPRRLVRDAAFGAWSPDGSRVAFRRFERAVEPGSIWPYRIDGLYLVDRSGRNARTVKPSNGFMMAPLDWSVVRPEWSPDGTRLVASGAKVDVSVRLLDLASRRVTHVGCGSMPSWWDDRTLFLEHSAACPEGALQPADLDEVHLRKGR